VLDASAVDRLLRIGGATLATQMIQLFLQHGPERVSNVESGFSAGDMKQIEHAAHSMKSSAGNLGAQRLQQAAAALESASDPETARASDDIGKLVQDFREEYNAAAAALTKRLGELG
jgi:HPt (histidine-containing phosphotransfer) domain-containing protein